MQINTNPLTTRVHSPRVPSCCHRDISIRQGKLHNMLKRCMTKHTCSILSASVYHCNIQCLFFFFDRMLPQMSACWPPCAGVWCLHGSGKVTQTRCTTAPATAAVRICCQGRHTRCMPFFHHCFVHNTAAPREF